MLARLRRHESLADALQFIQRYGSHKKRFQGRILAVVSKFIITGIVQSDWRECAEAEQDRRRANEFARYLRAMIPELWERFEEGLTDRLQDRTQCPFGCTGPIDNGQTFDLKSKRKCDRSQGCVLDKVISGEKERAIKLLKRLRTLTAEEKTKELEKIRDTLTDFFDNGNKDICYEMCNQGLGDLVIALETHPDRTLVTTNARESNIISPGIGQDWVVLPVGPAQGGGPDTT